VATVSHELRTPMTSIKGYVEILLMGAAGELNEQQSRFLEVVRENNDRLAVLVNDLLDISKIESGRISLVRSPLDLEGLVDNELDVLERKIAEDHKEIWLEKIVEPDLPRVYADMERVRQILTNLLDNAYQYNMDGGRVTVRLKRSGEAVQIDVQDAGVGIPPDEQPQVFQRFFRGESPLMLGVAGTGLGLSIVQSLVHMHGGEIWLESSGVYGEGTTFSFTLPIYAVDENILEEGKPVWQEY
jgi:signal transduction histidine kinase